jgi:hypothetical protein
MTRILGVSLGTRYVGTAVLYNDRVLDARVRSFSGAWSDRKMQLIMTALKSTIGRYEISTIAVKIPPKHHCSPAILKLILEIERYSEKNRIELKLCTVDTLKLLYNTTGNKNALAKAIIEKYPNSILPRFYTEERRSAYHLRIFEAVASTDFAKETGIL